MPIKRTEHIGAISAQSVNGLAAVVSSSGIRQHGTLDQHGVWITVTGSSPKLLVYVDTSPDDTAANFGQLELIRTIASTGKYAAAMTSCLAEWFRIRVIGDTGNSADTVVSVTVFRPFSKAQP